MALNDSTLDVYQRLRNRLPKDIRSHVPNPKREWVPNGEEPHSKVQRDALADALPERASEQDRGAAAEAFLKGLVGIGATKTLLDQGRLSAALRHNIKNGTTDIWARRFLTNAPDRITVPMKDPPGAKPLGHRIFSLVRKAAPSFMKPHVPGGLAKPWQSSMFASNALGLLMTPASLAVGLTSSVDAVNRDGFDGLHNTEVGRTGVLQSASSLAMLNALGRHRAREGTFKGLLTSTHLMTPGLARVTGAAGALTLANELGKLDSPEDRAQTLLALGGVGLGIEGVSGAIEGAYHGGIKDIPRTVGQKLSRPAMVEPPTSRLGAALTKPLTRMPVAAAGLGLIGASLGANHLGAFDFLNPADE